MSPFYRLSVLLVLSTSLSHAAPLCTPAAIKPAEVISRLSLVQPGLLATLPHFGSSVYALVDDGQIADLVADCWTLLRRQGILVSPAASNYGWRQRFNCCDFTAAFILTARLRHAHDGESEGHPAIFAVGYVQDGRSGLTIGQRQQPRIHSVALIFTPRGPVFVDPILGRVALSPTEQSTLFWYIQ